MFDFRASSQKYPCVDQLKPTRLVAFLAMIIFSMTCSGSVQAESLERLILQTQINEFNNYSPIMYEKIWSEGAVEALYQWEVRPYRTAAWRLLIRDMQAMDFIWNNTWLGSDLEIFAGRVSIQCTEAEKSVLEKVACISKLTRVVLSYYDLNIDSLSNICTYYSVFFNRALHQSNLMGVTQAYLPLSASDKSGDGVTHLLNQISVKMKNGVKRSYAVDSLYFPGQLIPVVD